jgi:hypothetical protein
MDGKEASAGPRAPRFWRRIELCVETVKVCLEFGGHGAGLPSRCFRSLCEKKDCKVKLSNLAGSDMPVGTSLIMSSLDLGQVRGYNRIRICIVCGPPQLSPDCAADNFDAGSKFGLFGDTTRKDSSSLEKQLRAPSQEAGRGLRIFLGGSLGAGRHMLEPLDGGGKYVDLQLESGLFFGDGLQRILELLCQK